MDLAKPRAWNLLFWIMLLCHFLGMAPVLAENSPPRGLSRMAGDYGSVSRGDSPVLIHGAHVPSLGGVSLDRVAILKYDPGTGGFVPVPFQIDERLNRTFNPGTPNEFIQTVYDVFGEDDGHLDTDDEIVFLFGDAGERAPDDAPWPAGADDNCLEVQVTSSLPDEPDEISWVYLFTGDGLPASPVEYVNWGLDATSDVVTEQYVVEYDGPWILNGFRVLAPCGDGVDLLDRFKGRSQTLAGGEWEDEDTWNATSSLLGVKKGPVRAIRYVKGAASGVNTIHHDVLYRKYWRREVNLRVHPLEQVRVYLDWLPDGAARFYSPMVPSGVDVDGVDDPVPTDLVEWSVLTTSGGGAAVVYQVPESPLVQDRSFHYVDDVGHDDATRTDPPYEDDDDSAYGASGIQLDVLGDSSTDAIVVRLFVYPLCSGEGDEEIGAAYHSFESDPLELTVVQRWKALGAVRSLVVTRDGDDVRLQWDLVSGADSYRVYRSDSADTPHASWFLEGEVTGSEYLDPGAAATPGPAFYSVVPVGPGGEGEW